jgi:predicted phosphodiesterase
MVLPDMHFPNHSVSAMRTVLQAIKEIRPDEVVLTGDVLDCSQWSRHPTWSVSEVAKHSYLNDEVAPFRSYVEEGKRWSGNWRWVFGNHDQWPERLLSQQVAHELAGDLTKLITPSALLKDLFKTIVPYIDVGLPHYEIAPNLWCVHGWTHSKHAAMKHLEKARTLSIVHGHTHRVQRVTERIATTDEYITAWSPGCLCEFQPMWRHGVPTDWVRGFSVIYHSKSDPTDWQANTHLIENDGRAVLEGGQVIRSDYRWGK